MLTVTSRASSHALVELEAVKAELGLSGGAEDTGLQSLIARASGMIAKHCNQTFAREGLRQVVRDIHGRDCLLLARRPATVRAVSVDGVALAPEEWGLPEGSARLMRLQGGLPCAWRGRAAVVEFDAGYRLPGQAPDPEAPEVPPDLQQACLRLVTALRESAGRDPLLRSTNLEQVMSHSWVDPRALGADLPPQVADALAPYRRRSFA